MAVVSGYPKEVFRGVAASEDKSQRRYTRNFEVLFDGWVGTVGSYEGTYAAKNAVGVGTGVSIPARGAAHPQDPFSIVVDKNATPIDDSPHFFLVTVNYESSAVGAQPPQNDDPLLRPPEYSTGSERIQVPLFRADYLGTETRLANGTVNTVLLPAPLLNQIVGASCGLLFDPLPEQDAVILTIVVTRNEVDSLGALMNKKAIYENTTNLNAFNVTFGTGSDPIFANTFTVAAGYAKMGDISSARQFENDIYFLRTQYQVFLDPRGFLSKILDQHVYERDNITKELSRCKDAESDNAIAPMPLNGVGQQLLASIPPLPNDPVQVFRIYRPSQGSVDWAPLGLF